MGLGPSAVKHRHMQQQQSPLPPSPELVQPEQQQLSEGVGLLLLQQGQAVGHQQERARVGDSVDVHDPAIIRIW